MYLSKYDLTGRVAVVTGGGGNIGLACAEALAEAGAMVIVGGSRDSQTARTGITRLRDRGYVGEDSRFDVRDREAVETACAALIRRHGRVDVLVCAAGGGGARGATEHLDPAEWHEIVELNLAGVFHCCAVFGRHMLERRAGAIVNIGSLSGTIVNRPQLQAAYNAAKAGVHHLTRSLATEWASRGVRVNAVAPTYVDAPGRYGLDDPALFPVWMAATPMNRQARADEVASTVLFLASDASSMITGQVMHVDGGYTCW